MKQRAGLFPQILIRNYIYHKIYVSSERERIAETQIRMTALQPLTSIYHSFSPSHKITGGVSLEPKLFEFSVEGERDAKYEIIRQDKGSVLFRINFDPPLKEGDIVEYWYRYSPKKSSTPFTLEEAKEAVPLDSHLSNISTDSVLILYPTERLKFEIEFDSKYPVYDPNFTVTIGFTNAEVKPEIERLRDEGAFRVERFVGRTKIILDVFRPFIGCRYTIYWKPPSEKDIV